MKTLSPKTLKYLRLTHRYLSFLCSGVLMIYLISGFLLNHSRDFKFMRKKVETSVSVSREQLQNIDFSSEQDIKQLMLALDCDSADYRSHKASKNKVTIQGKNMLNITVNPEEQTAVIKKTKRPPFLTALNTLHRNPGKLWTYFSDICLLLLVTIVITGLLIVPGKKGLAGTGGILLIIGILLPVLIFFLLSA